MWNELVSASGGLPLARLSDHLPTDLPGDGFLGVLVEDEEILPAVAELTPRQAVAFLALAAQVMPDPGQMAALLARLEKGDRPAYLLKSGRVGGKDPDASVEITESHARSILDAIPRDAVEWEDDPDFGYKVAAELPGIEGRDRFLLIPRLLYARTDRVYEYAARVPELKRERVERLSALDGLDPSIIEAVA